MLKLSQEDWIKVLQSVSSAIAGFWKEVDLKRTIWGFDKNNDKDHDSFELFTIYFLEEQSVCHHP